MAGNGNSGNVIAFRLSEQQLRKKIEEFRKEYGDGQHGMVTWPAFCAFLGYSIETVRECYLKGKEGRNAYNGRAELLEAFRTECIGLTYKTSNKQQALAKTEVQTNYLAPEGKEDGASSLNILFGVAGDDRRMEAMK